MCNTWFATNKHQNPHHISSINVSFPILCQSTDLHQLYSKIGRLLAFVVHIDFDVNSLAGRVTSNRYACHQMHRIRWTAATATTRYEHLVFFFHHRQLRRHTNIPTTIKSGKNRKFFFSIPCLGLWRCRYTHPQFFAIVQVQWLDDGENFDEFCVHPHGNIHHNTHHITNMTDGRFQRCWQTAW